MKKHDEWNIIKKQIDDRDNIINFKNREIYWARIGENIGYEQNGKGKEFSRPVLIIKKLNKHLFFGVPLSTQSKFGSFFFKFKFLDAHPSTALLVQSKVYDAKRIDQKIGMMDKNDFYELKLLLRELLDL